MDRRQIQSSQTVKVVVRGRVQGVGFRPFVANLARKWKIKGTVQNNLDGVKVFAQGEHLRSFLDELEHHAPRLSRMDSFEVEQVTCAKFDDFSIIPSEKSGASTLVIPIDAAICPDCLAEMRDPTNPRYRYPFITCTQCGPRYTIIEALPYDRPQTTMKDFPMCKRCMEEYTDVHDRRYHAEPIACPACGPSLSFCQMDGSIVAEKEEALRLAKQAMKDGKILAIKGIGGYHLACDALNDEAVKRLRTRKNRPKKPLAVMAKNLAVVREFCHLSTEEEHELTSCEAPIVVLHSKGHLPHVAPDMTTLGVMLPYAPLHHLLMEDFSLLVMTSANSSGLPMIYEDDQVFNELSGICDFVLTHNRKIIHPIDDSVIKNGMFLRRARGFVPDPIEQTKSVHEVVALGSQQKNVFALGRQKQVFLGPHIGDLTSIEVMDHFMQEYQHLKQWMGIKESTIAIDFHPRYATNELAKQLDGEVIKVQHHHAHHASCMADNHLTERCLGLILDGTGFGLDGHIWGFELLYGDFESVERLGHLRYTPLPGSEKAIVEPWRNAVGMLIALAGEKGLKLAMQLFPEKYLDIPVIEKMIEKGMNSPLAGTCGRLFDAVSAMLGVCQIATYDGEAAILLSEQCEQIDGMMPYPYRITHEKELDEIDMAEMITAIAQDGLSGIEKQTIIARFHATIVSSCVDLVKRNAKSNCIVLSGGSFHNDVLLREITNRLTEEGFSVYRHKRVPPNDGGLALGQLMIARERRIK